ncbi:hypothetical protein DFA_05028 [Cavenderia fasciculata]|uniref:Integral membrane bound transporter domain-containing protein n=1 Tax=Cavenderia fasciculata TaxID=261658 RepID=F4PN05_CACFS|nr:uncharacterized protein DFA_05028 [Cavenderia fasciculata]EGG22898.1 hypothetical protein DFA_05028 [Cavenderia fasciculata]|eukprot:XP_004360749.1 hypothetical protein DFA_05028 [Cavenderia fasciculata]
MDRYYEESKKEQWNYPIMPLYKDLLFLLERNHKELLSIHLSILEKVSKKRAKYILPLIPSMNTIVEESGKMFGIMSKQLSNYYIQSDTAETGVLNLKETLRHSQSNKPQEVSRMEMSLDYSQYQILESFECIENIITTFKEQSEQLFTKDSQIYGIDFDEQRVDYELATLHFFFTGIFKFASDQKVLSSIVYQIALTRNDQYQCLKLIQCYWFKFIRYLSIHFIKRDRKRYKEEVQEEKHFTYPFPPFIAELQPYTLKEKATMIGTNFLKRMKSDWRFSFRFALGVSVLSVAYYEILQHSDFILFRNLTWLVITFTFVMGPTVGGSVFFSLLRIVGTCFGVAMAYGVAVLFTRSTNNVADGFIFAICTFLIYFTITLFVREKSINNVVNFLILTYATISFPMFATGTLTIITSLLRLVQMKAKIQKEIREIGYLITKSQNKLFHSKFELFFQPQKYHRLKDILHLNERLFIELVSLEYAQSLIPHDVIKELKNHNLIKQLKLLISEIEGSSQTIKSLMEYDHQTRMASEDNSIDMLEMVEMQYQIYFHQNAGQRDKTNISLFQLESLGSTMHSLESFVKTFNLLRHFIWVHLGVRVIKKLPPNQQQQQQRQKGDKSKEKKGKIITITASGQTYSISSLTSSPETNSITCYSSSNLSALKRHYRPHNLYTHHHPSSFEDTTSCNSSSSSSSSDDNINSFINDDDNDNDTNSRKSSPKVAGDPIQ